MPGPSVGPKCLDWTQKNDVSIHNFALWPKMFCAQSKKKEMGFFGPIKNNFGDTDRPSLVFL